MYYIHSRSALIAAGRVFKPTGLTLENPAGEAELAANLITAAPKFAKKNASPFRDDQAEELYLKANVNYKLEGDEEPGV